MATYTNQAATKDTYINNYTGTTGYNYGASTILMTADYGGTVVERILIEFDLSDFDGPVSLITAAELDLYYYQDEGTWHTAVGYQFDMYRIQDGRSSWTQGTQNGATGDASWNTYKSGSSWTTAGCSSTSTDIDNTTIPTAICPAVGNWISWTGANMVTLVQDAINNRSNILRVMIRANNENRTASPMTASRMYIRSTEYSSSTYRPKLILTYTYSYPIVTSSAATSVATTTAVLNGNISKTGADATCSEMGFVYGTSSHTKPANGTAPASAGYTSHLDYTAGSYSTGVFSSGSDLTGLSGLTTYYFRSYAKNASYGYSYSATEQSFTTTASHRISNSTTTGIKKGGVLVDSSTSPGSYVAIYDLITGTITNNTITSGFYEFDVLGGANVYPHYVAFIVLHDLATLAATNITYTAKANTAGAPLFFPGAEGNKIRVTHTAGASLGVVCTDNRGTTGYYDVVITFVNNTTTASDVSTAIAADSTAKYVLSASTGSGKIAAMSATALTGGNYYADTAYSFITPGLIT